MTDFVIRDAVVGDMGALQGVFRRASLSNEGEREVLLAHPEVLELPDQAVTEGRTRAAVAEGGIVGFASWLDAGGAVEVEDMFVDPDWMRHGIGRALMMDLLAMARGRGIRRAEVTGNQHALAFYETVGFTVTGEEQTRFGPALRLALELAP
ncbi:MAG: GNAT family N-acetyltransferase [Streptosporangiaceae bacterium]